MNNFEFEIIQYNFEFDPGNVDFEFITPSVSVYENGMLSGMHDVEFANKQHKQLIYWDDVKLKRVNGYLSYEEIEDAPALEDIAHRNDAYSWGDHSSAGYLTINAFMSTVASSITEEMLSFWNEAFSRGDHAEVGYLTEETDPIFNASPAKVITALMIQSWNNKEDASNRGVNNGYAPLDSGGKIPLAHLPSTLLKYSGVWNASTNIPELQANDLTRIGKVYNVGTAGTQFGIQWGLGDWAIFNENGDIEKSDNSDDVVSVNGQTGVVTLLTTHIAEGTNKYYTEERVSQNQSVKTAYDHSQEEGNPHGTTKADVGLSEVNNTSDDNKPVSIAQRKLIRSEAFISSIIFG